MITPIRFDGPNNEPASWAGLKVKLEGISSDVSSLPTTVLNGSSFYNMQNGDFYKFDEENSGLCIRTRRDAL